MSEPIQTIFIPYYKWQLRLEKNCKWRTAEAEEMFKELIEQYIKRVDAEEKIELLSEQNKAIIPLLEKVDMLNKKIVQLESSKETCPDCDGSGEVYCERWYNGNGMTTCGRCEGKGTV
jgi:excinuclease UvrABC ATPase subunit